MKFIRLLILLSIVYFSGCSEKFDINEFSDKSGSGNIKGDTVYIPLSPNWTGFSNPQDIYIGNEPFIYVCDTDNNRIVMMNLAGQVLGTRYLEKPLALAQDYALNLIVAAHDTSTFVDGKPIAALFKIDMVAGGHNIQTAPLIRIFYKTSYDLSFKGKYTGISVFYDNSYYVSRTGPNNTSLTDKDNSVLIFNVKKYPDGTKKDTLIGQIPNLEAEGTGLLTANQISSMTSFKRKNIDFIMTLSGNTSFKTQWLYYNYSGETPGYENRLFPSEKGMMKINKFVQPEGVTVDNSGNIFIADAGKDSVYKFNAFGDEMQSFGGASVFNKPSGVAFFDKVLYVADAGNNRILRFVLSTDIQ
ncbi:MAG TPA: hypothetical protein PLT92_03615 [Ignavibacteriaceae bacterium]|jgi:hypothetical protein|nr:hypothetical protein [Ignavibacteriaceae bacterium]HOJ17634.1 hypothetical protein [Ignavibacteriaceae bacterium]